LIKTVKKETLTKGWGGEKQLYQHLSTEFTAQ